MAMQEMLGGAVKNVLTTTAQLNAFTGGAISNKNQRQKIIADRRNGSLKAKLTKGLDTSQYKKEIALQSSQMKQNERRANKFDIRRQEVVNAESAPFPFPPTMGKKDAYTAYANMIYPKESSNLYTAYDTENAKNLFTYLSQQSPEELKRVEDIMKMYNPEVTLDLEDMLPTQGNLNKQVPSYIQDPDARDLIRGLKNYNPGANPKKHTDNLFKGFDF